MPDTARSIISQFQRRHEDHRPDPRLQGFTGSYRFDVEGVGSWRLEVRDKIATMTESTAPADCVLRCDEADFVRIARGEQKGGRGRDPHRHARALSQRHALPLPLDSHR
jgi:SCP-2 sterol transfer family protein